MPVARYDSNICCRSCRSLCAVPLRHKRTMTCGTTISMLIAECLYTSFSTYTPFCSFVHSLSVKWLFSVQKYKIFLKHRQDVVKTFLKHRQGRMICRDNPNESFKPLQRLIGIIPMGVKELSEWVVGIIGITHRDYPNEVKVTRCLCEPFLGADMKRMRLACVHRLLLIKLIKLCPPPSGRHAFCPLSRQSLMSR